MAPKLAAFGDEITQNEKLFARIAAVYDAREKSGLTPEQQRLAWLVLHELRARRARSSTPRRRSACRRSTSASPTLFTTFSQNVLADENDYVLVLEKRGRPRRPAASRCARRRGGRRRGARPEGQVGDREHALERSSRSSPTPTAATCARRSGACSSTAATTATRHDNNADHHARSCSCAPSARSCSATRRTRTGASRTRWPRRPSARWS